MDLEREIQNPILLITFLRAENVARQLKIISQTRRKIYISIDGPRNRGDELYQKQLFSVIDDFVLKNTNDIEVFIRDRNEGIACAVVSALDWFFSKEEQGIIIEDDLDFDLQLLQFMDYGLFNFRDNSKVMMISGNNFGDNQESSISMANFPQTWGWSTWKNRWTKMRNSYNSCLWPSYRIFFDPALSFFWVGFARTLGGSVDTWDLPLAYFIYKSKYICVLPPVNLCTNNGSDTFASHTIEDVFPIGFKREALPKPLKELIWTDVPASKLFDMNQFICREVFGVSIFNLVKLPMYVLEIVISRIESLLCGNSENWRVRLEEIPRNRDKIMNRESFKEWRSLK